MPSVQVTVCGCVGLQDTHVFGKPSPYVELLGDDIVPKGKRVKTSVSAEIHNPTWNETLSIEIDPERIVLDTAELRVVVKDDSMLRKHPHMGECRIRLGLLVNGVVRKQRYQLQEIAHCEDDEHPEIHLRILAIDFGRPPAPEDHWKITKDIHDDPQLQERQESADDTFTDSFIASDNCSSASTLSNTMADTAKHERGEGGRCTVVPRVMLIAPSMSTSSTSCPRDGGFKVRRSAQQQQQQQEFDEDYEDAVEAFDLSADLSTIDPDVMVCSRSRTPVSSRNTEGGGYPTTPTPLSTARRQCGAGQGSIHLSRSRQIRAPCYSRLFAFS